MRAAPSQADHAPTSAGASRQKKGHFHLVNGRLIDVPDFDFLRSDRLFATRGVGQKALKAFDKIITTGEVTAALC
jgi:hypothetical protein